MSATTENSERQGQISIHPGVRGGKRVFERVNTCADSSAKRRATKALAGLEKHFERHPSDGVTAARIAKLKQVLAS